MFAFFPVARVRAVFKDADVRSVGALRFHGLERALRVLVSEYNAEHPSDRIALASDEIKSAVKVIDENGDGVYDFNEFLNLMYASHAMDRALDVDGARRHEDLIARVEAALLKCAISRSSILGEPVPNYQEAFLWFDKGHKGRVTLDDLSTISDGLGFDLSRAHVQQLLRRIVNAAGTKKPSRQLFKA